MRWVALQYVKPNSVLAQRVADKRGRTLLARGVVLTESLIRRLGEVGVRAVCIENRATDDILVREIVDERTKVQLLGMTYDTLHELATTQFTPYVQPKRLRQSFAPVVEDVIAQLKESGAAGDQLSSVYVTDGELFHHSVNVTFYALALGMHMGLNKSELIDLGIGTLLHDVGKLCIDASVLQKPGRLSDEEFQEVQRHAQLGYDILSRQGDISARSSIIALQHHERMDGSGYPGGLTGKDIHPFSQLSAVADVYEALTANRVYRRAFLPHDAMRVIQDEHAKGRFSDFAVRAFLETISIYPIGMSVRLSNGHLAVVVRSSEHLQFPIVRVIEDEHGQAIVPYEIDLATVSDIRIEACES
ncbi:phosphodiesterase [Alicyclobacillus hesperidum]|uniref:HD domain-containing protein n=1 Tax=Alicyclobacillus hesperidum TaxID=89784 RepID=A0A1H2TLC9_9BACL|nr:phosphodiesterase [Alicyclobacillus hesperidum]SDW44608.1 HD domain-containing protein [Alicyclobacillus hesperidum]